MTGILAFNTGSSSVKFALHDGKDLALRGQINSFPHDPVLELGGESLPHPEVTSIDSAMALVAQLCERHAEGTTVSAVGHRVVHGGLWADGPRVIDDTVLTRIRELTPLAPSHQPSAIAGIEAARRRWPGALQTASFDTSFHRCQPRYVQLYALPRSMAEAGILRYGFHGLSYDFLSEAVAGRLARDDLRVVAAHLGSGASLCAIRGRRSVATSMGFTALDGLPMATRCGNIDPGVLFHLMKEDQWTAASLERLLYSDAGLRGLSGLSGDMVELLANEALPDVREALAHFCHRVRLGIGEMAAALGGIDVLVFAGGVGENAAVIRQRIVEGLGFLGLAIDDDLNEGHAEDISGEGCQAKTLVIRTDEEAVIRRDAATLLKAGVT